MEDINSVVISGSLTRDPELRSTPSGTSVCDLRVAVNGRRKDQSGNWHDKPNFFDVTVWGKRAENCAEYLRKGRGVVIEGRLDWSEWEAAEGGKRQKVQVVGELVKFLPSKDGAEKPAEEEGRELKLDTSPEDTPAAAPTAEGDIPF